MTSWKNSQLFFFAAWFSERVSCSRECVLEGEEGSCGGFTCWAEEPSFGEKVESDCWRLMNKLKSKLMTTAERGEAECDECEEVGDDRTAWRDLLAVPADGKPNTRSLRIPSEFRRLCYWISLISFANRQPPRHHEQEKNLEENSSTRNGKENSIDSWFIAGVSASTS